MYIEKDNNFQSENFVIRRKNNIYERDGCQNLSCGSN